jgi:hypothetical protein
VRTPLCCDQKKSLEWLLCIDHQLRCSTGKGLQQFRLQPSWLTPDTTVSPYSWPELDITPDQGSDGVCAGHFLMYMEKHQHNVRMNWDPSHGAKNDLKLSLAAVGLWGHECLTAIAAKCAYGPWGEGKRGIQLRECMMEHFQLYQWHECPVFMHALPGLLATDGEFSATDENVEQIVWDELKEDKLWSSFGVPLSLAKFMQIATYAAGQDRRPAVVKDSHPQARECMRMRMNSAMGCAHEIVCLSVVVPPLPVQAIIVYQQSCHNCVCIVVAFTV